LRRCVVLSVKPEFGFCYWCGSKDHKADDCPVATGEKLRRCWQEVAGALVEGDYIGSLRGEVNVCLNVINYYKALGKAVEEVCDREQIKQIRNRAYQIRQERYGRLLW
jgi:hypothetical protein